MEQYLIDLFIGLTGSDSCKRCKTFAAKALISRPTSLKSFGAPIDRYHIIRCIHRISVALYAFLQAKQGSFVMLQSFRDFAQSGAFDWLMAEFGA